MRSHVVGKVASTRAMVTAMTAPAGINPTELIGDNAENQSAMASIAVSPLPITAKAQPSRPNGIRIIASMANGMTITDTNGIAARFAPRLSGETRWKW